MTTLFILATIVFSMALILWRPLKASAHCDTYDGPTALDGKKALESGNINHALKWVPPQYESELTEIFTLSQRVRTAGEDARELADRYFIENLIRLHRAGEGEGYSGVKPPGTPIDEKIAAADRSIAMGDLTPLKGMIEEKDWHQLEERFEKAMALKHYDVDDLEAARHYIEAYVEFFKLAEGEEHHGVHHHAH